MNSIKLYKTGCDEVRLRYSFDLLYLKRGSTLLVTFCNCPGAGSGLIRAVIRLVYGVWIPHSNEIMHPTL